MRLIFRLLFGLIPVMAVVLAVWAFLFYSAVAREVDEGVDDRLDDYAERIIIRVLAGENIPVRGGGADAWYELQPVGNDYVRDREKITFSDDFVYIREKDEKEPVRVLTTLFKNGEGRYFELAVFTPTLEKDDLQEAVFRWTVVLYAALLFFLIIICLGVFYRSFRPLYVLLRWLKEYRIGGKNKPLDNPTGITEFRRLNRALAESASRSEELFEQQKLFIGNASHEMQTPLAVCMNRLELLMEEGSFNGKQSEELARIYGTLETMSRLNRSLLLLSRIENGQFADAADLELNSMARKYLEDYGQVYGFMNIRTELLENGVFRATINPDLASVLLSNLIKNAFVHNRKNGQVCIGISPARLLIRNTGPDSPLDESSIFRRFYRDVKKEGSAGLGLALVESICKLQPVGVRYYFKEKEHCFEIYRKAGRR